MTAGGACPGMTAGGGACPGMTRRQAPSPVFLCRRRVRPLATCNSRLPLRGAERRQTRELAKLPERLAKPPETPCEGVSSALAIGHEAPPGAPHPDKLAQSGL